MEKKNVKRGKTITTKRAKKPLGIMSTQLPPTEAQIEEALAARNPTKGDLALMNLIAIKNEKDKFQPISLSTEWYEFTVFVLRFGLNKRTAGKWLTKGWLSYSLIGKLRFINKSDIEIMMLRFRKSAFFWMSVSMSMAGGE